MNFNVKGKFMKRTARAMMMVLLFSFALSVFLYAGVGTDSALIPNDFSAENGIAQAGAEPATTTSISALGTYEIWSKISESAWNLGQKTSNQSVSLGTVLQKAISNGAIHIRIQFKITNKANADQGFYCSFDGGSNFPVSAKGRDETTHYAPSSTTYHTVPSSTTSFWFRAHSQAAAFDDFEGTNYNVVVASNDSTAPSVTQADEGGVRYFIINDAGAGLKSVTISDGTNSKTYDWTSTTTYAADGVFGATSFSSDTRTLRIPVSTTGNYTVKASDNVGNTYNTTSHTAGQTVSLFSNYPSDSGKANSTVVFENLGLGDTYNPSNFVDFSCTGYILAGWYHESEPGKIYTEITTGSTSTKPIFELKASWKSGDFGTQSGGTGLWGSATNPFVIESDIHLANLSEIVNGVRDPVNSVGGTYYGQSVPATQAFVDGQGRITYEGCYFIVTADVSISYTSTGLRPIGASTATPFRGNFDGDGKTITVNASLSGVDYVGLFGYMDAGSLTDVFVTSGTGAGNGVLGASYVGGVAGWINGVTLSGTIQSKAYVKGTVCVGGLFGVLTLTADCSATLKYSSAGGTTPWGDGNNVDGTIRVGGIAGLIQGGGHTITSSISVSGDIDSTTSGGFVGGIAGAAESVTISPATAQTITPAVFARGSQSYDGITGGVAGGLVGYLKNSTLNNLSYSGGNVISVGGGAPYCGGAVGYAVGSTISNVTVSTKVGNNGSGTFAKDYTGGIVGYLASGTVSHCMYSSSSSWAINGASYTGGIAGYNGGTISYCFNIFGGVTGSTNVGAVSGNGGTITASYSIYRGTSFAGGNYSVGVPTGATVTPLKDNADTNNWLEANGFKIAYTVANNTYLSVVERNTTTGYKPSSATYTVSGTTKTLKFNFASATGDARSFVVTEVAPPLTTSYVFDGSSHQVVISGALPSGYSKSTAGNSATYVTDGAVANTITVTYSGVVMGTISTTVTITAKQITVSAKALTLVENQRPGYDVDILDTAHCTISGVIGGHSVTTCVVTDNYNPSNTINSQSTYTISIGDIVIKDGNGVDRTANYAITKNTATLTVRLADYGRMQHGESLPWGGTVNENATWGSATNPYYIALDRHFNNLRAIVNGAQTAVNSVNGINGAVAQASTIDYAGAYFVLGYNVNTGGTITNDSLNGISYTITSANANWGYEGERLTNIFDNNSGTKFCDGNMAEVTVDFNLSTAKYVDGFSFTNAGDSASNTQRIPEQFIIYGHNGTDYVEIGNVRDSGRTWNANTTTYYGSLDKPGIYQRFRVVIRSRAYFDNGNKAEITGTSPMQLAEFDLTTSAKVGGAHTPIGKDTAHPFNGNFNGNGHTVTITTAVTGDYAGLFGYMRGGSVTNITVAGQIYATGNYVGALVGHTHTDRSKFSDIIIDNVTNNATVTGNGSYTGGIIGCAQDTDFKNTITNNGTVTGVSSVGGVTGYHFGASTSGATIVNNGAVTGSTMVGGYAGDHNWGDVSGSHTNNGTVKATGNYAGGVLGKISGNGSIGGTNVNNGIVMARQYVGGIIGSVQSGNTVSNNSTYTNTGHVHGVDYVGGAFGYLHTGGNTFTIKVVTNASKAPSIADREMVSHTGLYAGGFFGWIEGGGRINFANGSQNTGQIDSAESQIRDFGNGTGNVVGGIVGVNVSTTLDFSALTNTATETTINGNRRGSATVTISGTQYTGALIGGIAGYNGGNIIGRNDKGTLCGDGNIYAVSGGAYIGGAVGVNAGGTLTNIVVDASSAFNNTTFAKEYVGGVVGYMSGGTLSGVISFKGNMVGTNYVGGIVGRYVSSSALTLENLTQTGNITSTGNYVGGFFGEINTNATVTLNNLTNTGNITGANHVGGIAGQINGVLSTNGLVNGTTLSGTISGTAYVGGIFGEIGTTASGSLNNAINRMTISASGDYIGGVVGIHHRGTVENCVNLGAVTGKSNVGGVIGRSATNAGGASITVRYCLNNGAVSATGGNAGGVIGFYYAGSHTLTATYLYNFGSVSGSSYGGIIGSNTTANLTLNKSWAFYDDLPASNNNVGKGTATGYYVANTVGATVLPLMGSTLHTDWTTILTNDFNGFYFASGIVAVQNQYLSLETLNSDNVVTGYAQPSTTLQSTHDTGAGTCTFNNIGYAYANSVTGSNIRARFMAVGSDFKDLVYDGTDKAATENQTEAFAEDVRNVANYTNYYHFTLVNKSDDTVNVGTFTYDAHMVVGGVVMGCARGQSATIRPFDINSSEAHILFDGVVYGGLNTYTDEDLNKTLTDITAFKNEFGVIDFNQDAVQTFYIYRFKANGEKILVYSVQLVYGASNMLGTHHKGNGVTIALDGAVSTSHGAVAVADGYLVNRMQEGHVEFAPSANYVSTASNGTLTLNYYAIDSDYLAIAPTDRNGDGIIEPEWGSVDNPYVISHWIHLLRLSEIVNGVSAPINSVRGIGAGNSANARSDNNMYSAYVGADGKVKRSYFLISVANITMPNTVNFRPIGGWVGLSAYDGEFTVFNYGNSDSNYFGGILDGEFADGSYATIDLGTHLGLDGFDYVGLFGIARGSVLNGSPAHAEVRNLNVIADGVSGNNYVGTVVGNAVEYVIIDGAYANKQLTYSDKNSVTINGVNYVGSVVGSMGVGTEIYGDYVNYAKVNGAMGVGGIVGRILSGAGRQGTGASANNYYLGEYTDFNGVTYRSSMVNYGTINGTQVYAGGIVGIMEKSTGNFDGVITVFEPTFLRNEADVFGMTVVGGLVGRIDLNHAIRLINTAEEGQANWSYNGGLDTDYTVQAGTNYAGGLFGTLSTMGHQLTSVFSTSKVESGAGSGSSDGKYIGGLVGYMNGGTFNLCFVTIPGTQNLATSTDRIKGNAYVGGLAGEIALGTFDNCYVQGFKFDNNLSNTKGGVAGVAATVATVKDTWALYVTADPTYSTVPANSNGKYILAFCSGSEGAMNATIDEMLVFAGLTLDSAITRHRASGTSAGEIVASKGSISIGITLPVVGTITNYNQKAQVTFYDGSGYEEAYQYAFEAGANDSTGNNLFIRVDSSAESVIIAKTAIRFGSITNYTNASRWEEKYLYIGESGLYKIDVAEHPTDDGNNHKGNYQTSYSFDHSATGNYVYTSRYLTFQYAKYSEVAPRVIASQADWNAFAAEVRNDSNGTVTVGNYYVKLATNSVVVDHTNIAGLESTPYFNGTTVTGGYFGGIFDGDGYYITVNINGANAQSVNEIGVFPQARDATFQNLTIRGNITTTGSDVGAFVGAARGPLTFYNCTNQATVYSTGHNIGGILGTANNQNVVFIGCVNEGNITAGSNYYESSSGGFIGIGQTYHLVIDYGVGGIVGSTGRAAGSTILIDSCRNKGNITGDASVGGIVGACKAAAQITNCGNTGYCHATNDDEHNSGDCAVGGIVGSASQDGGANIYACYNSGTIVADGNKAGGIMGTDAEYDTSSRVTKIYNCYNTGSVYTGSVNPKTSDVGYGVQAGGIIGVGVRVDINYCYNVGTITANGYVTHGALGIGNAHGRVAGIVGQAYGNDGANNHSTISNVYNAGQIVIGFNGTTSGSVNRVAYAAGIVGCVEDDAAGGNGNVKLVNAFSFEYQVYRPYHYNANELAARDTAATTTAFRFSGAVLRTAGCALSGTYLSTVDQLTCTYDAQTGVVRPKSDEVYRAFGENGKAPIFDNSYQNGTTNASELAQGLTSGGYVFVYGCLPQLAVFALDTENGTAMTSQNYVKDKMGVYHLEKAGSENNPYIIKDGIDLMGINALSQANYNLDGKYIEFANGTNNLAGDVAKEISMPSVDVGNGFSNVNSQHYYQFKHSDNSWRKGKSYHLFEKGAYCSAQTVGEYMSETGASVPSVKNNYARNSWMSANDYWDGDSWESGANLTTVNFYPIGRYYSIVHRWTDGTGQTQPKSSAFKGNIDGSYDGVNPVVIANIRMSLSNVESHSYTGYPTEFINYDDKGHNINANNTNTNSAIGLFGFIEDATVKNIAVTGTIKGYGSGTVSVGVIGKALGNSVIDGVHAGADSGNLLVRAFNGSVGYVGGIVGMTDSGVSGNRLTIENCVVTNATITGFKDSIGGIVGYTVGADAASFTDIIGCHVKKATISSTATVKRLLGGIIGAQGDGGAVTVEDCQVGTSGAQGTNVTITGDNSFGGIISYADASATCANAFINCYVYEDVLLKIYNANNHGEYGTAIGGIVGYISDSTGGYATFRDYVEFYGTIDVKNTANVSNVGGVVGYMGVSARMENCTIKVYGLVDASGCANAENIGGFAGISKGVALDGGFAIAPTLKTGTADNVGGFIGLNAGDTYITRTSLVYTSRVVWTDSNDDEHIQREEIVTGDSGSIVAHEMVGGFIGKNNVGCELHMGASEYKGTVYGNDDDKAYIDLRTTVDGLRYIGGFLGYNAGTVFGEYAIVVNNGAIGTQSMPDANHPTIDCIGGVFGDNSTGGVINISEQSTFINNGQVGHSDYQNAKQEFVGGIIGVVLGDILNKGTLQNTGSVYGYEYVGGAIGGLVNGEISGVLTNGAGAVAAGSASTDGEALVASDEAQASAESESIVQAVLNVGGVIGVVMQNAIISGAEMYNFGEVKSSGDNYNVSNLGGAIGLNYGVIEDSDFYNYGKITAKNFAGGALGVSDGVIRDSNFYNYATITFTGDTALGGAVGYITNNYTIHGTAHYYPNNNPSLGTYNDQINRSTVTGSYFGYESTEDNKVVLQATGEHPYPLNTILSELGDNKMSAFVAKGGLGGVFGAINSDYMTSTGGWGGNTFFIYGDVYGGVFLDGNTNNFTPENFAGTVDAVGGVIGAVEVSYIRIHDMLIYKSNVGGRDYVGGIVGYNDNSNDTVGAGASIDNCYNVYGEVIGTTKNGTTAQPTYNYVGGIVGFVPSEQNPGMINGLADYNKPTTNASYWIKSYSNEHLQNSNPKDIVNTLDKASTWTEFLSHGDYINDNDPYYKEDEDGNVMSEGYLGEGNTWASLVEINQDGTEELVVAGKRYVQNANGDWGSYQSVDIKYTTGERETGFYYIFAESTDGEYAEHAIEVEHNNSANPLVSPYTNDQSLNYWLIIANSASQPIKSYASDQVSSYVNGGNVVPGYIYSTAYTATKNGYYLYVSDGSAGNSATEIYVDANDNSKVYVSSDASEAGNVMIFYKEAVMLNHLNYNGYERYAPIAELEFKQDMSNGVFGKQYYSFIDDVPGDNINTGKEAGSYEVKASIYTVDTAGIVFTLGTVDSTDLAHDGANYKWNIRKRTLEVEFTTGDIGEQGEDQNLWNRYDGTFSHYIKFTVTNFAKDEDLSEASVYSAIDDMLSLKYSMNGSSSTTAIDAIYDMGGYLSGTQIPDSSGFGEDVKCISYYTTGKAGSSAKPGDKSNSIVDGNYTEIGSLEIYQATYIVFVKLAGKHTVKVEVAGSEVNHANPKKNTKDYSVDVRNLSLSIDYSKGDTLLPTYVFDGGMDWQGIQSITVSGFLTGDAIAENIVTSRSTASLITGDGKADKAHVVVNGDNTVTINFFASNVGTYEAVLNIGDNIISNYRFVTAELPESKDAKEWRDSWIINPYQITLENVKIEAGQKFYYNGEEQSPKFSSGEGGTDFVVNHGKEVVNVYCDASISDGSGVTKAVNVGTYTINVTASGSGEGSGSVEGDDSKATAGIRNYKINYTLDDSQQAVTFDIQKREVRLVWNNPQDSFVYDGTAQGLGAGDLKFEMKDDKGNWVEYTKARITIEGNKVKVDKVFEHDGMSETLYFDIREFTATDAGSYTAEVTEFDSVSGNNDAGVAEKSNYTATLPADKNYSIAKSQIVVTYNNTTNLNKTFDNTSTVTKNLGGYTLDSKNGGAKACTVTMSGAYFCDSNGNAMVNVGSGYYIRINLSLSDTKNYTLVSSTITPQVNASITPAPLTITLNNSSSGQNTVYKTFDNSDLYAQVESNGTNRVSSSGVQMRTGRGITVSGFFTSGVTVTANFAEMDANRAWASKYVNNVTRTQGSNPVYSMSDDDYYKKLVITLSNNDGGIQASNYYIAAVETKSGTVILTQSSGQSIEVMDSRAENSNTNGDNIKIAITKYSLKATYSNTAQSYANPDNSYNLDWLEIDGTLKIPSSWGLSTGSLDVEVTNGWMYVNGTSGEKKKYEQYTRIAGSMSSTRLGAKLSSDEGFDLCVTLRNQPTLVIGYFVSQEGEEIGTMAGLLIATEYYKNNFNESGSMGYDFTQTVIDLADVDNLPADVKAKIREGVIDTWEKLVEAVPEYDVRGYEHNGVEYDEYSKYYDLKEQIEALDAKANKTEQEITDLEALKSQLDSYELTYVALSEGAEETLQYVYWKPEKVTENRTFKSFVLVDNIDAILTKEDVDMLTGAFGSNWGAGKKYLTNVVFAEVGSVVIFNGPVFGYVLDGEGNQVAFNGEFDGAGYHIDHLTIAYNATTAGEHNVGLFAEVSGVGSKVTGVNLRNLSIQVYDSSNSSSTVLNVGGVAGKFAGSTLMEDVTVHGAITAVSTLGTVHVGGVIGGDSTGYVNAGVSKVVEGAIVVATLRAEGNVAVAGGIVGIMNEINTTLTDVVSMSEIYAEGNTTFANGFVGRYNKYANGQNYGMSDGIDYAPVNSDGKTSAYMESVFEINNGTYTRISGGVSYTELMKGSTSSFDGNRVYLDALDVEYGKYDVVSEKNAIAGKNTTGSMRLRDIVEVYVLGYELTAHNVGTGESAISTVKKSSTSKYVGTADGTVGNEIKVAYQQHLSLIRMFNYMNFVITKDVTMYTGYTLKVVDEAFTGSVNANGHFVNVRNEESSKDFVLDADGTTYPQFFAYQNANFTWLKKD